MMLTDLHMHSNYSDGMNSPEEMIQTAVQLGYDAVAITDHVWKTSSWVSGYAAKLRELRSAFDGIITVYSGVEAKVLTLEGDIDAEPTFGRLVDFVLGSFHRMPRPGGFYSKADANTIPQAEIAGHWLTAFYGMLGNPLVDIIAHPLSELKAFGIPGSLIPLEELAAHIAASGKILELNVRYNTPEEPLFQMAKEQGVPILVSSDSHSVADLKKHSARIRQLSRLDFQIADIERYLRTKQRNM